MEPIYAEELKRSNDNIVSDTLQTKALNSLEDFLNLTELDLHINDHLHEGIELEYFAKQHITSLITNFVILKGEIVYEIADTEFYLFSPDHQDITVYERNLSAGRFFFHESGTDLTFKSKVNYIGNKIDRDNSMFGGVLISALIKTDGNGKKSVIKGPKLCTWELWDSFNALKRVSSEWPVLLYKPLGELKIEATRRHFPIKDKERKLNALNSKFNGDADSWEKLSYFINLKYRFRRSDLNSIL